MKITVIGCGRWGSFLAWYLDKIGNTVKLYGRVSSKNMQCLLAGEGEPRMPATVKLCTELDKVLDSDVFVISVNSQGLTGLLEELAPFGIREKILVLCMKGLEVGTGRRLSQIAAAAEFKQTAVWLGPGHVQEFTAGIPNCMVIDSADDRLKKKLIDAFSSELIRFYYGQDLIGNEIGAAAKNVIGIAAGMLDGLKLSTLKGALMSRGTREIARLMRAMGGMESSAYGLCHLGDYEATVFSKYSHNRMYGELLVKGEPYDALAEGYYTVAALMLLEEQYAVELPICRAVYTVLYEGVAPKTGIELLFSRSLKEEFYD